MTSYSRLNSGGTVRKLGLGWTAAALLLIATPSWGQQELPAGAKDLYIAKCGSCHTIGKGVRVGPDLKDTHTKRDPKWLVQMIEAPSALLDSDPTAKKLLQEYNGVRMPDLGLSTEQSQKLADLIAICSVQTCELQGKFVPVTRATAGDATRGQGLFLGDIAIESGAPPCVACHAVENAGGFISGGTLAKDLTHSFALMGDEGLAAALQSPNFPLMNKIFGERPLNKDEAFALRAFLYEANRGGLAADTGFTPPVTLAGVVFAIVVLFVLNWFWSRRLRGVRKPLVSYRENAS
jgi:mono/diheme cytochrome c family protein